MAETLLEIALSDTLVNYHYTVFILEFAKIHTFIAEHQLVCQFTLKK